MDCEDYLLLALAFAFAGFSMLLVQQATLQGQYPMWQMFSAIFFCCGFLAIGLVLAGFLKHSRLLR